MADFTLSRSLLSERCHNASLTPDNIAYTLFMLFRSWAGTQLLDLLVRAPGVRERLVRIQEAGHPRMEVGLGADTIFGLIPFLVGCLIFTVVTL